MEHIYHNINIKIIRFVYGDQEYLPDTYIDNKETTITITNITSPCVEQRKFNNNDVVSLFDTS